MKRPSGFFWLALFGVLFASGQVWSWLWPILVATIVAIVMRKIMEKALQRPPPSRAAVLVTGTSSGFGRLIAFELASKGLYVFAGVRRKVDGEKLLGEAPAAARSFIQPIILDVTNDTEIATSVSEVRQQLTKDGRKLFAIINNAGMTALYPLETVPMDKLHTVFNVNFFGGVNIIQCFLPVLREYGPGSHIVNITSMGGLLAYPYMTPYTSSKHAMEALSDSLRVELKPWGIHVSAVEPGFFNTEIFGPEKYVRPPPSPKEQRGYILAYESHIARALTKVTDHRSKMQDPVMVAHQISSILFSKFPPSRVTVGYDAPVWLLAASLIPDTVTDVAMSLVLHTRFLDRLGLV